MTEDKLFLSGKIPPLQGLLSHARELKIDMSNQRIQWRQYSSHEEEDRRVGRQRYRFIAIFRCTCVRLEEIRNQLL